MNTHQYNTKQGICQQVEQKKLKPMVAIAAGVGGPAIKACACAPIAIATTGGMADIAV